MGSNSPFVANTIASTVDRDIWRKTMLEEQLRRMLIAEAVCEVNSSDLKIIQNPYGSQPTALVTPLSGSYTISDYTTTDDDLTVDNVVKVAEHVFDFEEVLSNFDLFENRTREMIMTVAQAIDTFVLNNLCEEGTGSISTLSGGLTTAANWIDCLAKLIAAVSGYSKTYNGMFIVVENSDLQGIIVSQANTGFSFADAALRNGLVTSQMGVDIYVTRDGTFADATAGDGTGGTTTYTNDGHRVGGVKKVATYASPRGVRFEEKGVTLKTGKEIVCWGYIGFNAWTPIQALIVDITLTA